MVHLDPSGSFLSKEVLRGMAAWCCWRICWHCRRSGPCVGEPRDIGAPAAVGTRCQVVFLLKGVLYSQGVPSLSTLYSTMGIRYSSEQPLRGTDEETEKSKVRLAVRLARLEGDRNVLVASKDAFFLKAPNISAHFFEQYGSCLAATLLGKSRLSQLGL